MTLIYQGPRVMMLVIGLVLLSCQATALRWSQKQVTLSQQVHSKIENEAENSMNQLRKGKLLLQTAVSPIAHGTPTFYSIFENAPSYGGGNIPLQKVAPLSQDPDDDEDDFPRPFYPNGDDDNQQFSAEQPQGQPRHLWLSASAWVIITWALLAFALISMIVLMTILYKKRIIQGRRGQGGQMVSNQFIVHVQGSNQPAQMNRNPELAGVELDGEEVYTYNQEKTEQAIQAQKTNKNLIAKVDIKPLKPNVAQSSKQDNSQEGQSKRELSNIPENGEATYSNSAQNNTNNISNSESDSRIDNNINNNDKVEANDQQENINTSQNTQIKAPALSKQDMNIINNEISQLTQIEGLDMRHQCLICFEDYKNEEQVKRLKCQHTFHHNCVSQWFQNSNTCPFCRVDRYVG